MFDELMNLILWWVYLPHASNTLVTQMLYDTIVAITYAIAELDDHIL